MMIIMVMMMVMLIIILRIMLMIMTVVMIMMRVVMMLIMLTKLRILRLLMMTDLCNLLRCDDHDWTVYSIPGVVKSQLSSVPLSKCEQLPFRGHQGCVVVTQGDVKNLGNIIHNIAQIGAGQV